jgi:hypothetical protein
MTDLPPDLLFITELLHAYDEGVYTKLEIHWQIFKRIDGDNVGRVIAALPSEFRSAFVEWAREQYDNTDRPSDFIFIGGEGGAPSEEEFSVMLAAVRGWFAANPRNRG